MAAVMQMADRLCLLQKEKVDKPWGFRNKTVATPSHHLSIKRILIYYKLNYPNYLTVGTVIEHGTNSSICEPSAG